MIITEIVSITELARLTRKSRPTIYKYINEYNNGNLDEIPYSIIKLFDLAKSSTKAEIISYCNSMYATANYTKCDGELQDLIDLIVTNREHLEIAKIKKFILGEINHD